MAAISTYVAIAALAYGAYAGEEQRKMASKAAKRRSITPEIETPAIPETQDAADIASFGKKRAGRAETVLTGELMPESTGKKRLLA